MMTSIIIGTALVGYMAGVATGVLVTVKYIVDGKVKGVKVVEEEIA